MTPVISTRRERYSMLVISSGSTVPNMMRPYNITGYNKTSQILFRTFSAQPWIAVGYLSTIYFHWIYVHMNTKCEAVPNLITLKATLNPRLFHFFYSYTILKFTNLTHAGSLSDRIGKDLFTTCGWSRIFPLPLPRFPTPCIMLSPSYKRNILDHVVNHKSNNKLIDLTDIPYFTE